MICQPHEIACVWKPQIPKLFTCMTIVPAGGHPNTVMNQIAFIIYICGGTVWFMRHLL